MSKIIDIENTKGNGKTKFKKGTNAKAALSTTVSIKRYVNCQIKR